MTDCREKLKAFGTKMFNFIAALEENNKVTLNDKVDAGSSFRNRSKQTAGFSN